MVIIGIDPAFRKDGYGVCFLDMSDRTMRFETYKSVLHFQDFLNTDDAPNDAFCVIENSNLDQAMFNLKSIIVAILLSFKFPKTKIFFMKYTFGILEKVCKQVATRGRNIGKNQAISQISVGICERRYGKKNVRGITPKQKGAKLNNKYFQAILRAEKVTIHKKTSNQDERDAGQLALKGILLSKRIVRI